jgi:hypothetical protein
MPKVTQNKLSHEKIHLLTYKIKSMLIPTQTESPKGLHQRYHIEKVVKNPDFGKISASVYSTPEYITVPTDEGAEYFVMRLDTGGSDLKHISACRLGINAYADAIEPHLPELAKDLRERYPLLTTQP